MCPAPPTARARALFPPGSDRRTAAAPLLASTDAATAAAYNTALSNYKTALANYNKVSSCGPLCVGGSVDPNGNCICTNGTPYVNSDGKIYCVPNDLSSVPNTMFDPAQSKFVCKSGFAQSVSGDNTCYNVANTSALQGYINQLTAATSVISKTASTVVSAYGKVGNFYIAGQAAMPSGTTQIGSPVTGVTTTAACATGAPSNATVFVYNPQTLTCTYYSGSVALSGLTVGNNTVGSVAL